MLKTYTVTRDEVEEYRCGFLFVLLPGVAEDTAVGA